MRKGTKKWNDIKGYEGLYQLTRRGEVYSFVSHKILKPQLTRFGYLRVQLWKDGKQKKFLLHRLIAIHFIPNPNTLPHINHKKGVKIDNRISKLEWCTAKENMQHAHRTGLKHGMKGKRNPMYKAIPSKHSRSKKAINTKTGEIDYWKNIYTRLGITAVYFCKMMNGYRPNSTDYITYK